MRTYIKWISLCIIIITMCTCYRQDLENKAPSTALIHISFDWSISRVPTNDINAVSVYFFPINGDAPIVHVSNNIYETKVQLPIGAYSVLIFNETTGETSWSGTSFTGTDKFETFMAVARPNNTSKGNLLYTKAENDNVVLNQEPLAAWSLDKFDVTSEMVYETRGWKETRATTDTNSKAITKALEVFVKVKLQPRTTETTVTAKITNLNNAHTIAGVLRGVASGVYLVSGKRAPIQVTHLFTFQNSNHIWESADKINGTARHIFYTFGKHENPDVSYSLQLDALLHWGELPPPFMFDVTEKVKQSDNITLRLDVGLENGNGDRTIELEELKEGVDVGDWDKGEIEIK
ncbi:MAG: DUF5119 domain-containing protein [Marinifilaceae bacterium]